VGGFALTGGEKKKEKKAGLLAFSSPPPLPPWGGGGGGWRPWGPPRVSIKYKSWVGQQSDRLFA